jgi:hypothetical protein
MNPNITAEQAYGAAGFSEDVIQDMLKADERLCHRFP